MGAGVLVLRVGKGVVATVHVGFCAPLAQQNLLFVTPLVQQYGPDPPLFSQQSGFEAPFAQQ